MTNTVRIILAGIAATAFMTMVMIIAPYMGLPKMDVAGMLAGITHTPRIMGWFIHFMIGVFFAFIYASYFNIWLTKITNNLVRGMVYGFIVFVFAQIMVPILTSVMLMPEMPMPENKNMLLMIMGSLIAHVVFGVVLGLFYDSITVTKQQVVT